MFFLVKLQNSQRALVPQKWIQNIDEYLIKLYNYGIKYFKNKPLTVYISKKFEEEPDFKLNISNQLQVDRSGCYKAYILKSFGKISSILFKNKEKIIVFTYVTPFQWLPENDDRS